MDLRDFPEPRVGGKAWPLSTAWLRKLTSTMNALLRLRVTRGNTDKAVWSEGGLVIQIKNRSTSTEDDSSSGIYKATINSWTSTNDYASVDYSGGTVNAALPVMQRQAEKPSSAHGDAVAVLWPTYSASDVVFICQPDGGTGVTSVDWLILDSDRQWCFEHRICAAGGTYYSIIPGWSCSSSSNGSFNPVD